MALPAATTRSPDGILCEGPPYVVLKHPSRWRSDPWRFVFGRWVVARALGVGRWVCGRVAPGALGVGCLALGAL